MKKNIWFVIGILGIFSGAPSIDAVAGINIYAIHNPSIVIKIHPMFINLPGWGISVSVGSPYDILCYGKLYYIYHPNSWYRSPDGGGPWFLVKDRHLPSRIRRHSIAEIRRFRDAECNTRDLRKNENRRFSANSQGNYIIGDNEREGRK